MEQEADEYIWKPVEGLPREKRIGPKSEFAKRRGDHRNSILKDWAIKVEPDIEPKVPIDYISPFDKDKCVYCLTSHIGRSKDEFRPKTQRGRYNIVNCLPCCGSCNSSKQDKCGTVLIEWIKKNPKIPVEQKEKIINWFKEHEKYMLIPLDTLFDKNKNITYGDKFSSLDSDLNKIYEMFL